MNTSPRRYGSYTSDHAYTGYSRHTCKPKCKRPPKHERPEIENGCRLEFNIEGRCPKHKKLAHNKHQNHEHNYCPCLKPNQQLWHNNNQSESNYKQDFHHPTAQDHIPCCIRVWLLKRDSLTPIRNAPITLMFASRNGSKTLYTSDEGKVVFKPLDYGKYLVCIPSTQFTSIPGAQHKLSGGAHGQVPLKARYVPFSKELTSSNTAVTRSSTQNHSQIRNHNSLLLNNMGLLINSSITQNAQILPCKPNGNISSPQNTLSNRQHYHVEVSKTQRHPKLRILV